MFITFEVSVITLPEIYLQEVVQKNFFLSMRIFTTVPFV